MAFTRWCGAAATAANSASTSPGTCATATRASSGCVATERRRANATRHGGAGTPVYEVLDIDSATMPQPEQQRLFPRYGGRGIEVCERWTHVRERFSTTWASRPKARASIGSTTIGEYEPGNCRWATPVEQGPQHAQERHAATRRSAHVLGAVGARGGFTAGHTEIPHRQWNSRRGCVDRTVGVSLKRLAHDGREMSLAEWAKESACFTTRCTPGSTNTDGT